MKKDCSSCVEYNQGQEECMIWDLLEYDPEEFDKECPKMNGAPEYQDDFNE